MFSLLFLIFILAQDAPSYYLVVKPGKLLEIQAEPRYEGKFCYFVLPDGEPGMLAVSAIDRERTDAYNKELAEKRQEELAAEEAATAEVPQPEEPKVIEITSRRQIPSYARETTTSTVPQRSAEEPAYEGMIGQPKVMTYTQDDDFYISKETIVRLATGYHIECELLATHPRGVSDASVTLEAYFVGGGSETIDHNVTPVNIAYNQRVTVSFDLSDTNDLLSTEYKISYSVGPDLSAASEETE